MAESYASELKQRILRDLAALEIQRAKLQGLLEVTEKLNGNHGVTAEINLLPPVLPGDYPGMTRKDALEYYMRQRKGNRIPLSKIVADLLAGGVDPGEPRKAGETPAATLAHNIKIGLSQPGSRLYGREPEGKLTRIDSRDIKVWLDETAAEVPPAPRRRRSKTKKAHS